MNKNMVLGGIVAVMLLVGGAWALPVYGGTFQLHTVNSFVEGLIAQGIIPPAMADKARVVAGVFVRTEAASEVPTPVAGMGAEHVQVSASQYINYSDRTYAPGEDIEGLILLVENTSDETIELEAKRGCQITYRIYRGDELVFDRDATERCQTDERVQYLLEARTTRMFPVRYVLEEYGELQVGGYRMEIEYPGYGEGELTFTVVE